MKRIENVCYTNVPSVVHLLDIYLPEATFFPVFVYFHGGGLQNGTKSKDCFYEDLVKRGIAVVTADYRMYPTASFPDFIKDAAGAVAWAYKNMGQYGEVTNFFVGGSSAGAYLSMMLCFDKKYLAPYGINPDTLGGFVHDAGQPTVHFNVLRERGIDTRRVIIDEAAPIYHITGERDYAPMQIIVSDQDMQNRPAQNRLLVSTLKHFGYDEKKLDFREMKNSTHCSYVNKQNEQGEWILAKMIEEFISTKDERWHHL